MIFMLDSGKVEVREFLRISLGLVKIIEGSKIDDILSLIKLKKLTSELKSIIEAEITPKANAQSRPF